MAKLARPLKLIGVQGIVRMAMSGFDVACWERSRSRRASPWSRLLGGAPRASAPTTATASG